MAAVRTRGGGSFSGGLTIAGVSWTRAGTGFIREFYDLRGSFSGAAGDEYPGVLRRWGDTQ
jgi:hypothetical protein